MLNIKKMTIKVMTEPILTLNEKEATLHFIGGIVDTVIIDLSISIWGKAAEKAMPKIRQNMIITGNFHVSVYNKPIFDINGKYVMGLPTVVYILKDVDPKMLRMPKIKKPVKKPRPTPERHTHCLICGRPLSTDRSMAAGMGPGCAKKSHSNAYINKGDKK